MIIANRRRYYSQGESIKLPDGYKLAKYFYVQGDFGFDFSVELPRTVEALVAFNSRANNRIIGRNGYAVFGANYKKAMVQSNLYSEEDLIEPGKKTLCTIINKNNTTSQYLINGVDTGLKQTKTTSNAIGLFRDYSGANSFYGRCYYVKIYKNNVLTHWLVPCKDSNGNGKCINVVTQKVVNPDFGTVHVV